MELKSEIDAAGMNLGKNYTSFFFYLEKYPGSHNAIRKVIHDAQEITDHQKVNNDIFLFYKKHFEEKMQNDSKKLLKFLNNIPIPSLAEE